jgi:hypothetical protein
VLKTLKKAPAIGKDQEMRVFSAMFGVFGLCDQWRELKIDPANMDAQLHL